MQPEHLDLPGVWSREWAELDQLRPRSKKKARIEKRRCKSIDLRKYTPEQMFAAEITQGTGVPAHALRVVWMRPTFDLRSRFVVLDVRLLPPRS